MNFLITLFLASCLSFAADKPEKAPDWKAGEEIAMRGTSTGATACVACHGTRSEENLTGAFPRLVNQSAYYLETQLKDFSSGDRNNDVMSPIAKALTAQQKADVAAYYAKLIFPSPKLKKKPAAALLKRGELLATMGDLKIQVQSCNSCHGPGGIGVAPTFPALAGQYPSYMETQLKAWKTGQRKNSPDVMLQIAKLLSDKDIEAVAAYFQTVPINTGKGETK